MGVGDERTRVAAGEAVLWPADVPHAAWTEHSEMRAFVVEFAGADDSEIVSVVDRARALTAGGAGSIERGEGALAERELRGSGDPVDRRAGLSRKRTPA